MLKFYYHPSPNPAKIALFLEESGLPYELILVDTHRGEQHLPAYLAINPNAKTPALVDGAATVFDSNAILLYLAEKTGRFLPGDTPAERADMYSWLMFLATGLAPMCGQLGHFKYFAPQPSEYALNRYTFEAWRHWDIIEARLAQRPYMLGEQYTIVDMAVWGWARVAPFVLGEQIWERLPHVKRWFDAINARPAAVRAEALKDAQPYKADFDAETLAALFRHNRNNGHAAA
ncbi:glutathione S-transferase family protein [Duganella violaceipulchra]|uniref:GST-like protein n=1 Tax=Duganella violaceipulchra TaxID=2849652 RepID=A0AA41L0X8_9BURK|nr:glutathione S-transferase N-terminal domain-containing protein [Duganella violaceicalia]MBV6323771.1 glutathione S-transferase N-terminal domain-containing protein [Duganella violaceicalia]MCP2007461.1 GST-like protein [Duganella violaceicalia]